MDSERQILDVGCGDGLFFDQLARFGRVSGIEPDRDLVDPQGPHSERIHIGLLDSAFSTEKPLDWILMLDVLEHMNQPSVSLQQARKLLRGGGKLIVTVPAFNCLWTRHDEINHHQTRYRIGRLKQLVSDHGFVVESSRYFFHWTFPVKLLIRLKESLRSGDAQPPRVPSRPVNWVCHLFSVIEQRLLGRLPVPFGSSILLVARRLAEEVEENVNPPSVDE